MGKKSERATFGERIQLVIDECCDGNVAQYARIMRVEPRSVQRWLKRRTPPSRGFQRIQVRHEEFLQVRKLWLENGSGGMWLDGATGIGKISATLRSHPVIIPEIAPEIERRAQAIQLRSKILRSRVRSYLRSGWTDGTIETHIRSIPEFSDVLLSEIREIALEFRAEQRAAEKARKSRRHIPKLRNSILFSEGESDNVANTEDAPRVLTENAAQSLAGRI